MNDVVRFPADVPYYKWPALYEVFAAMSGGDFAEAERRWNAKTQDCLDAAGAVQYWYDKFTEVDTEMLPAWGPNETDYRQFDADPKKRYAIPFTVPNPPVAQASPVVRVTLSSTSGNTPLLLEIVTEVAKATIMPGQQQGSSTPMVSGNWPQDAGKTFYAVMALGAGGSGDIRPLVQIPTAL